jgi:glycosyltransferase involved in cell wall biosynthesis
MKFNILITFTPTSTTLGNACRLEMVDYLSQHFDSTIITNRKAFIQDRFPDCAVIGYESRKNKYLSIVADFLQWKKIAENINKIQSDFVFMFDDTSPITLWLKQPVFQYVHQYGERSEAKSGFFKKIVRHTTAKLNHALKIKGLKKSKMTFVVSKPIIEILRNKGVKNLLHTPHGVEIEKFRNPYLNDIHASLHELREQGHFLVTYTGWVTENRGFQLMLDSLRQAAEQHKKIVLVIAGADKHFSERIAEYAKQYHLERNILNFGVIDAKLIPGILHHSDVCLSFLDDVPAYRVSPPQKVVEYFAAGKPVICNKIATHEWLVNHGKNGFILNSDPKEVSEAILRLKNDETLYRSMAENAFQTAEQYDMDHVYGNMVKLIKNSLNEA